MSTKNEFSKKKGFDLLSTEETEDGKSDDIGIITPSKSKNISNFDVTMNYLKNRDPMKEFFSLVIILYN